MNNPILQMDTKVILYNKIDFVVRYNYNKIHSSYKTVKNSKIRYYT